MVAGAAAGSLAVLLLHPFDVIKTRLQVQDGLYRGTYNIAYRNTLHVVAAMYRSEGWRSFYGGLTPAWIGSGVAWGAYFYFYEAVKSWHLKHSVGDSTERLGPGWHLLSAAQAGAVVGVLTNPIWLVKTRLQLQRIPVRIPKPLLDRGTAAAAAAATAASSAGQPYRGFVDALVRIGREEGWRGYYKGLGPSLFLQTTHGAIQFTVYEELKHWGADWVARLQQQGKADEHGRDKAGGTPTGSAGDLSTSISGRDNHLSPPPPSKAAQRQLSSRTVPSAAVAGHHNGRGEKQPSGSGRDSGGDVPPAVPPGDPLQQHLTAFQLSVCAVTSKLVAAVSTYPCQVIRSRLQQRADAGRIHVYRSAFEVMQLTWQREGPRGFYKGLGPALLRVMPQSAVTLVAYEKILQMLTERQAGQREGEGGTQ